MIHIKFTLITLLLSAITFNSFCQDIGSDFQGGILVSKDLKSGKGIIIAKKDLGKYSWERAKFECMKYNEGGFQDWKLPEIGDFSAIYDYLYKINRWEENHGMSPGYYWSGTVKYNELRYCFRFGDQNFNEGDEKYELNVRPVRIVTIK